MHVPVLVQEVMEHLRVQPKGFYIDATVGEGGHAEQVLSRLTTGRLLGVDSDPSALRFSRQRLRPFGDKFQAVHGNFEQIDSLQAQTGRPLVDGILADIGVNSSQLEAQERGFSFSLPGPLDMRMNPEQSQTAADFVNYSSERDLANLIDEFGEERYSRRIARALVKARPLRTTTELAQVVTRTVPSRAGLHQFSGRGGRPQPRRLYRRLHPATRVFQALRIAVNRELDVLATFLKKVPEVLAAGGRLVVISFHSLEDRIVKQTFQGWRQDGSFRLLTRKVVRPSVEEIRANPRSRSARLRAAEKV